VNSFLSHVGFGALAALCVGAFSAPLGAQPAMAGQNGAAAAKEIAAYARCIVKGRSELARRAVTEDWSNEQLKKFLGLIRGGCLPGQGFRSAAFPDGTYLYALADALVAVDYRDSAPLDFHDVPPLTHRPAEVVTDKPGAKTRYVVDNRASNEANRAFLSQYGECVVRAAPAASLVLLRTETHSAEETRAFGDLQPALSACIAGDAKVGLGRTVTRGAIAVNYYRLARAARGGVAPHA
jgi:hypothetical protein